MKEVYHKTQKILEYIQSKEKMDIKSLFKIVIPFFELHTFRRKLTLELSTVLLKLIIMNCKTNSELLDVSLHFLNMRFNYFRHCRKDMKKFINLVKKQGFSEQKYPNLLFEFCGKPRQHDISSLEFNNWDGKVDENLFSLTSFEKANEIISTIYGEERLRKELQEEMNPKKFIFTFCEITHHRLPTEGHKHKAVHCFVKLLDLPESKRMLLHDKKLVDILMFLEDVEPIKKDLDEIVCLLNKNFNYFRLCNKKYIRDFIRKLRKWKYPKRKYQNLYNEYCKKRKRLETSNIFREQVVRTCENEEVKDSEVLREEARVLREDAGTLREEDEEQAEWTNI